MSVTISGTSGVTTPGIANSEGYSGDGLTIAAGAPAGALRIDTSGNAGLGVAPSAWGSGRAIQTGTIDASFWGLGASTYVLRGAYYNSGYKYTSAGIIPLKLSLDDNGFGFGIATSTGTAGNPITFTQAMTLDASGNLGVGSASISGYYGSTSVATRGVYAYTSSSTNCDTAPKGLVIRNDDTTAGNLSQLVFASLNTGNTPVAAASIWSVNDARSSGFSTGSLAFGTVGGSGVISERARIDASGNMLVGTTSGTGRVNVTTANASQGGVFVTMPVSTTAPGFQSSSATAASTSWYHFVGQSGNGSTVTTNNIFIFGNGNISNTNNSYGSISDIKLKENITDSTDKLHSLMQVRVVNYNLKSQPNQKHLGVIAQEVEQIFPSIVDESPDRDADGNDLGTVTKSVKYSVFVPMLIKAIQEQQAMITELKARIEQLETK